MNCKTIYKLFGSSNFRVRDRLVKINKKMVFLFLFTVFGLMAVLSLQTIWLYNTYRLIKSDIYQESCSVLKKALEEEGSIRFSATPKGTKIASGPTNDTIPPETSFYQHLSDMGYPMSLNVVDSIVSSLLKKNGIKGEFVVCVVDPIKNRVLQKSKQVSIPYWIISSEPFPIRVDYSQMVQLMILDPYMTFFARMDLLMIASFIMLVLVIGCISYQIKVIFYQKKIAKLRADFSFAMIHDMKTPLTAIMSCANLLRSGGMEQKIEIKEKFFSFIKSESVHLLNLTNKILSLSRLESHKALLSKKRFQLEPMLQNMTELFQVKAEKPVHFTLDLQVKEVYADEDYLGEAISNLIDNAVKYSKESVEITISTSIISKGNYTMIKVRDNGLGFSQEDKNVIFGKFERASAFNRSSKGGVAGFGLGLNYVYQVMEAHGGEVTANSVLGEFSEFMLLLPQEININTENNRYYERNNQTALG